MVVVVWWRYIQCTLLPVSPVNPLMSAMSFCFHLQENVFELCEGLLKPLSGANQYTLAARISRQQDILEGMESLLGQDDYYPPFHGVTALLIAAWNWKNNLREVHCFSIFHLLFHAWTYLDNTYKS